MKTILTVLDVDKPVDAAITEAHAAVKRLADIFVYDSLEPDTKNHRHPIVDARALLETEIEARNAGVAIDSERRTILGSALSVVRDIIKHHAWGILVGNDDAERDANIALIEQFEAARRIIVTQCYDIEAELN